MRDSQTGFHSEAGGVQNASKQSEDQQAEHSDVSQPETRFRLKSSPTDSKTFSFISNSNILLRLIEIL